MKALLSKAVGGPETLVLDDVPSPEAKPGHAVISVKAIGVNFPDVLIIEDRYQFKPERPFAPGGELSGVVKSVGEGVTNVKPGDRVLANTGWGAMAEEVLLPAARLWKIPDSMPHDDAAAFILTYGTTWHALTDRGHVKPGETLLVLGAAGGVGLSAVELGKAMGAKVIAACSTQEKVDLAIKHGADSGVVYGRGPFDKEGQKGLGQLFKDATGPNGADVIYDAVGGDYAEPALRSIAWEGRYLVIGFAAGDIPRIPLNLALLKGCDIVGVFWGAWTGKNPAAFAKSIEELLKLYDQGKIKPHISERFPLARGADAIAHLGSRQAMGKVVITVD
ncbi:MAG TPA: NADPH:quinone oxidoreductase family protein [Phenylobacterium sp.]|jgi:NADPH2:quinone reductase|uniref:NADPH:quinone oxidoreductase family protein n=1 Tax=Phenylobacterium sp. TaxID=1871053 RepID=UPI002D6C090C|nr:NADPH:quinone oxidoreductase family protein [Phenylobacterium sp.]HZZ70097.1 NADPH:quinone oxidoreductase family protein [Phenylobacterium sp.]